MEIPNYQPFYIDDLDALRSEAARLGLELPIDEDLAPLAEAIALGQKQAANRFCVQPMSGNDAEADGAPSAPTRRRYRRFAYGGAGLIWIESTAAGMATSGSRRLALNRGTLESFRSMADEMRQEAAERWGHEGLLILQLAPALPRNMRVHLYPTGGQQGAQTLLSDADIGGYRDAVIEAGALAAEAGFDGVDVQSCRGALAGVLLGAFTREGEYGGLENRSRFLCEALSGIREQAPGLILASRLCAYDAVRSPYGFGVDQDDYRKIDLDEPTRLVGRLQELGLGLLNSNVASPNLSAPTPDRAFQPQPDGEPPDEHPLMVLDRQLRVAAALRAAAPGVAVVGSGFSWLRHFLPEVAAGAIAGGAIDIVGLGRGALADPGAPGDVLEHGRMNAASTCMVCFACNQLRDDRAQVGCPIRDPDVYGAEYRGVRSTAPDRLLAEARRCHLCEAAPCVSASCTQTDIPAFIGAYRKGDERGAYQIIRQADPLPEMTAQLTPGWLHSEGACIESALSGNPIPILDLQYAISWGARQRGETGLRIPSDRTGKKIAIVGGGPTGIAAAVCLLEHGHDVEILEHSESLGGTPARVIPSNRFRDPEPEIEALLKPAIDAGRLRVRTKMTLGQNVQLEELRNACDVVLLATGLWQERALAEGNLDGVIDALTLLEGAKRGDLVSVPARVAVLAGGDCAMDAAKTVMELGAKELFVVFGGPRSAMHWHMPEDWFATPGVNAMMLCQPKGYQFDDDGQLQGLRVYHTELEQEGLLRVGLAVEAMGLESADALKASLAEIELSDDGFRTSADRVFAAGGLTNGGASVSQCIAEGRAASEQIHREIS